VLAWILLAGVLSFPFAASRNYLLLFSALSVASIGLSVAICVYVLSRKALDGRLTRALESARPLPLLGVMQLVSLVAILLINARVIHSIPHIGDEAAYWFQAKVFATFHLYLAPHALKDNFPVPWVITPEGKWYAVFPFGWPLLLSPFMVLGVPQAANMAFSFGILAVFHKTLQRLPMADIYRKVALIVLASSPFFLLMGAGYMGHTSHLFFFLAGLYFFVKWLDRQDYRPLVACAILMGIAFLIRPMETVIFLVAVALLFVALLARRQMTLRRAALAFATLAACVAPFVVLQLHTNAVLTGSPTRFPSDLSFMPGANRLGFGKTIGVFRWSDVDRKFPGGHSPIRGSYNTYYNMKLLDAYAAGAPIFLFLVCAFFVLRTKSTVFIFYKLLIVLVIGGYALYWYHGIIGAGPRFYFCLLPLLVVGYATAAERIDAHSAGRYRDGIVSVLCACCVAALLVVTPLLCRFRIRDEGNITEKYPHLAKQLPRSSLVVIENEHPWLYSTAMMLNDVPVDRSSKLFVYAWAPSDRARILEYYRGRYRNVYRYDAAAGTLVRQTGGGP
jgi:hypothetical protein